MNQYQADRMAEEGAKQVPLAEQLASVPETARLVIDDADGMGTRYIPIGRMCKEAAAALVKLTQGQEPYGWVRTTDYGPSVYDPLFLLGPTKPAGFKASYREIYTHPIPSQQEEPGAVLEGWQLVPVEPTKEMLDAYLNADGRFHSGRSDWAAMLSAAPKPQGE